MNNQKNFYNNYYKYFRAIELCIENKLILPSLTLIYSGIDTFAWVAYGDIGTKKRFVQWVEQHMYKERKLSPKPIDLYAARCAILHTLTPDSDLSKGQKAVPLCYAWGNANLASLEKSVKKLKNIQTSCVHVNELFESFRLGVANFLEMHGDNPKCLERMAKHYSNINTEKIDKFNDIK